MTRRLRNPHELVSGQTGLQTKACGAETRRCSFWYRPRLHGSPLERPVLPWCDRSLLEGGNELSLVQSCCLRRMQEDSFNVYLLTKHNSSLFLADPLLCPAPAGTLRPVRRNYYDPSSAPGKGVVWEWENDNGSWTPYDMEVGITIQHAYEKQHPWIDLTSIGFSYVIDFSTMGQINRQTQRQRRVRRRLDLIYPMVTSSLPKAQSWPANPGSAVSPPGPPCSCPQCVLVMSVKAAVVNGSAGPLQPPAARKNVAPSGVVKLPPPPGPGTKPLDSTGTIRGPIKSAPSQPIRRQASGAPTGATAGSPASPPGASVKTGRVALATLNRTNLQRLAIAQSRVLIASG